MNDQPDANNHPAVPSIAGESIDVRMRRLESAIASLQDTRIIEERVLERVQQTAVSQAQSNALVDAGKSLLPGMLKAVGSQFDAATSPSAPPGAGSIFSARTWLLTDLIQEVRTFFVMYFDYRYKPTWMAKVIPPAALVIFLFSWLLIRNGITIPVIGPLFDYALNFFLVIVVYKTLQREAARYRSQIAFLPPI